MSQLSPSKNSIYIKFGDISVINGSFIDASLTHVSPNIYFSRNPIINYIIVLYDPDSHEPAYLHFLGSTINNTISSILPYSPMEPPNKEIHRYILDIYIGQDTQISTPINERKNFNINQLVKNNNLQPFLSMNYFSQQNDQKYPHGSMEDRYCRCVRDVKNSGRDVNPFAICSKSVGRTGTVSCKDRGYD